MRVIRSHERAFTIVEIIVAAFIAVALFAGAMYFIVGSGKSQSAAMVRARMATAADDVSQRVRADGTWLTSNVECKVETCDISDQFQLPEPKAGQPKFIATITVTPIDGEGDGTGANDLDHVRPDYYRIKVVITLAPGQEAQFGKIAPFETISSVDATAIGKATGSIVVQTCEVVNQVDERMSVADCVQTDDRRPMKGQPACDAAPDLTWAQWTSVLPPMPMGCNDALNAAQDRDAIEEHAFSKLHLRAVTNVNFTIKMGSVIRTQDDAVSEANGTYVFEGLPAGTYQLDVNPGAGRELWETKTSPSAGELGVQGNQRARALIVVRPKQGGGEYNVRFTRTVHIHKIKQDTISFSDTWSAGGATFKTTTVRTYLVGHGEPDHVKWDGPAWSGILSMEPKPYDRYRDGSSVVAQKHLVIAWAPYDLGAAPASHPNKNGWWKFEGLPTGLHSLPLQQKAPSDRPGFPAGSGDTWGKFDGPDGSRTQVCHNAVIPGGTCGDFGWITPDNKDGSHLKYHNPNGECYKWSEIGGFEIAHPSTQPQDPRSLQNGGDHDRRCSRDLKVTINGRNFNVDNFFPTLSGVGGKRVLVKTSVSTTCIANCEPVITYGGNSEDTNDDGADGSCENTGSCGGTRDIEVTIKEPDPAGGPPKTTTIAPAVAVPQAGSSGSNSPICLKTPC